MTMTVRAFINNIATGEYSKNDILIGSREYPDKTSICEEIEIYRAKSDDPIEIHNLSCALDYLLDYYGFDIHVYSQATYDIIKLINEAKDSGNGISNDQEANMQQIQPMEPLDPVHQVNVPQERKRGRQTKPFRSVIISEDPDETLAKMHSLIDGKIGKDVALVIQAAIITGKITKPTASQVQAEFGDIGNVSGYNKCMREKCFTDEEMRGMMNHFEEA